MNLIFALILAVASFMLGFGIACDWKNRTISVLETMLQSYAYQIKSYAEALKVFDGKITKILEKVETIPGSQTYIFDETIFTPKEKIK